MAGSSPVLPVDVRHCVGGKTARTSAGNMAACHHRDGRGRVSVGQWSSIPYLKYGVLRFGLEHKKLEGPVAAAVVAQHKL